MDNQKLENPTASGRYDIASLSHIAAIVAPIALTLTGLFYIAGYYSRNTMLFRFGIARAFSDLSLQATLADGFPIILIGSLPIFLVVTILWFAERRMTKLARQIRAKGFANERSISQFAVLTNINITNFRITSAVLLLSYGLLSGSITGDIFAENIKRTIDGGCKIKCFKIHTNDRIYVGRIVEQDQQRVAVYSKLGILIFESKEIKRIEPIAFERSCSICESSSFR